MNRLPTVKLPNFNIPNVRGLPNIPNVGCVSGNATTIVGEQLGNLPDISALPLIKDLKKNITEQIGALIDGQLPYVTRPPKYAARAARLVSELQAIVNMAVQISGQVQAEINAGISFCNEKIGEINAAKNEITSIPQELRNTVQKKALDRYNKYAQEINAQIGRLNTAASCLADSSFAEFDISEFSEGE